MKTTVPGTATATPAKSADSGNTTGDQDQTTQAGRQFTAPRTLASRPSFYLVYLLFYFVPWIFKPPATIDLFVAALALGVYVPVHFKAFAHKETNQIGYIILMELLAFATAPFNGMQGVFHIYASVQAGYQRPEKRAGVLIAAVAVAYLLLAIITGMHWIETVLILFIAAVTGITCMADAEQIERTNLLERSRRVDQQLAAIAERERIARDLHDLLGHTLTLVALKCEVADKLMDTDPHRAHREIAEIRDTARLALKDVRATVTGMNIITIADEVAHAKDALRAAAIEFRITGQTPDLSDHYSKIIGLAIREAVTNIIRHSMADTATLDFSSSDGHVLVTIKDNGHGGSFTEGTGLSGLRQRIERIGGQIEIDMQDGAVIKLYIPDQPQDRKP